MCTHLPVHMYLFGTSMYAQNSHLPSMLLWPCPLMASVLTSVISQPGFRFSFLSMTPFSCVLNHWRLFLPLSSSMYLFRLMAVVVHHGDMHSGHFVTYRRSPPSAKNPLATSSQWLWVSDDSVRKASLQEVLSSSAYLLFYERVLSRVQRPSQEYKAEE